jgi:hypothetical protein
MIDPLIPARIFCHGSSTGDPTFSWSPISGKRRTIALHPLIQRSLDPSAIGPHMPEVRRSLGGPEVVEAWWVTFEK